MNKLSSQLFNQHFSHIYVEKDILDNKRVLKILSHYKNSNIIEINHYKDVFSRSNQDFVLQKQSPKLILAQKKDNLIYKGADVCEDFGNKNFYYTSIIMNCIYDCEYCYLQGMYTSANIVVFVNMEDYFAEVEEILKHDDVYLCISYDTDILSLEGLLGYTRLWIDFAKFHKNLKIEIRTKSANFSSIEDITPSDNVILAWTLSPDEVIKEYENKTPKLSERINSIKSAINKGWKIRLCFDPILYIPHWEMRYKNLIEEVFNEINSNCIQDVSLGVFRVSKDYLKKMRKQRQDSLVLNYPYETEGGISSYSKDLRDKMLKYVYTLVKQYIPEDRIYV